MVTFQILKATLLQEAAGDDRALFNGVNRSLDNDDVSTFKSGFGVAKFTNFKTDGSAGKDATFPDADFFLMRAAEAYLNFAEADAHINGGETTAEGTAAINAIRKRANASTREDRGYSLNDICDEWSRGVLLRGSPSYGSDPFQPLWWQFATSEHLNIFCYPNQ